jgi:NitT/TauT family transport system ATP-binding protein
MTIFMITHDVQESFKLGTRLLVFDKVRHDPQEPDRYGARVTYDIPLRGPTQKPGRVIVESAFATSSVREPGAAAGADACSASADGVPVAPPA